MDWFIGMMKIRAPEQASKILKWALSNLSRKPFFSSDYLKFWFNGKGIPKKMGYYYIKSPFLGVQRLPFFIWSFWQDTDFGGPKNHIVICRFICSDKWSDLENARSHSRHWKGRSPVCFLVCLVNSSLRANFQPQPFQLQTYGFSPVCVLWCAFKWLDLV